MSASSAFQAGRLDEAIALSLEEVRSAPADRGKRTFLFELLVFAGELERAERQLNALEPDDPQEQIAVQVYRDLLAAEKSRQAVFFGKGLPEFRIDPPRYAALHIQALERSRQSDTAGASERLREASEQWPELGGERGGSAFDGLRDLDDFLAPFLEVYDRGSYLWFPLSMLRRIEVRAPRFPRDLIWCPARIEVASGEEGDVFLPSLYPGTSAAKKEGDGLRLGRATEWADLAGGIVRGAGLKCFLVGDEDVPLPSLGELTIRDTAGDAPKAP